MTTRTPQIGVLVGGGKRRTDLTSAIGNRRHLQHVLGEFVDHTTPIGRTVGSSSLAPEPRRPPPTMTSPSAAAIRRRDPLGGLLHEYTVAA